MDDNRIALRIAIAVENLQVYITRRITRNDTVGIEMASEERSIGAKRKLIIKNISQDLLIHVVVKFFIFHFQLIHYFVLAGPWDTIMMLQIAHLLCKFLQFLVMLLMLQDIGLGQISRKEKFPDSSQQSSHISIIFLMICICCEITSPIQAAIVVPNRKDVLVPCHNWLHLLSEDFSH